MLVIEISNRVSAYVDDHEQWARLTLKEVMFLQSWFRRAYPPYFRNELHHHGECLQSVKWLGLTAPVGMDSASRREEFDAFSRAGGEPPMYAHWRAWFGDRISPYRSAKDRDGKGLTLQQLVDDRIPGLSFIAVRNPAEVSRADLDRLPAFDPPSLEYDETFRSAARQRFEYLRFQHWGTRYYCNGTSFTMLTSASEISIKVLRQHLRRHYTHLAVLSHYQHAALLYFADEWADIAKNLAGKDEERREKAWRERIRVAQHRFLKFRTRSFFTEVSNQIQGKELFRLWYERLGTEALLQQVSGVSTDVYQTLEDFEAKELAMSQAFLAHVATWGLGASLGLSVAAAVLSWAAVPDTARFRMFGVLFDDRSSVGWLAFFLFVGVSFVAIEAAYLIRAWKRGQGKA